LWGTEPRPNKKEVPTKHGVGATKLEASKEGVSFEALWKRGGKSALDEGFAAKKWLESTKT